MRKKRLKYTIITSFIYQVIAIICGFILPKLILNHYNSEVNGLVSSITSFLNIITILDLGVGTVVCSALYKPLAEKNNQEISKICKSATKYFKNIGRALLVYMAVLPFVYLLSSEYNFSLLYTATLIFSMGISLLSQYYFGIVNRLLVTADQKEYIQYILQTITLVLTTICCTILMHYNASIQTVKLATSVIYLIRPIFLAIYVRKKYDVNLHIQYDKEPIKQKWNGISQHLAAVVLDSTDTIILTLFSALSNVSIYSVYFLVIHGLRQLIQSVTSGIQSYFGNLIAKNEKRKLANDFTIAEWLIHVLTSFIFGCTIVLIIPFIQVYTKGVNDANYIQPIFGVLLTTAHLFYCLRIPYHLLVKSYGHYKETQNNYIIAAILNIIISVLLVKLYGLIGVAIGTLIAMLYQTIWMARYCYKKLLNIKFINFFKLLVFDIVSIAFSIFLSIVLKVKAYTYIELIKISIIVAVMMILFVIITNIILYMKNILNGLKLLSKKNNGVTHGN